MKLTFAKINWWWHLEHSEGRTPESATKFVLVVKIKSIQDAELRRMWVGQSIIWFKLCCAASSASSVPYRLVESPFHHSQFLTLKSPMYIAIVGGQSLILMIVSSHRCLSKENCSLLWLGEWCKTDKKKRLEPFRIPQTRHSSSVVKSGLRASGKWSLKYKQTPHLHKLEAWLQRKKLYPSIASLGSSDEIEESKKVLVRQEISNWWTFKKAEICESLEKCSTHILFKFQWQTDN